MTDSKCERFEHTIEVVITTQFPYQGHADLVKSVLGPWCKSSRLISSVDNGDFMDGELGS